MTKENIAALQAALARGDKSFDFGAVAEWAAKKIDAQTTIMVTELPAKD